MSSTKSHDIRQFRLLPTATVRREVRQESPSPTHPRHFLTYLFWIMTIFTERAYVRWFCKLSLRLLKLSCAKTTENCKSSAWSRGQSDDSLQSRQKALTGDCTRHNVYYKNILWNYTITVLPVRIDGAKDPRGTNANEMIELIEEKKRPNGSKDPPGDCPRTCPCLPSGKKKG